MNNWESSPILKKGIGTIPAPHPKKGQLALITLFLKKQDLNSSVPRYS